MEYYCCKNCTHTVDKVMMICRTRYGNAKHCYAIIVSVVSNNQAKRRFYTIVILKNNNGNIWIDNGQVFATLDSSIGTAYETIEFLKRGV